MRKSTFLIGILLILGLVLNGCTSSADVTSQNAGDDQIQTQNGSKSESQVIQENLGYLIEDGVYNETIYYSIPNHEAKEEIQLNLEIVDGVVTSMSLDQIDVEAISSRHIGNVDSALQTLVVGKNINEVELADTISGSSLTTAAVKLKLEELSSNT